ncbi:hypothetical protein CAMGR0001_0901 [Campylobacter gracilis RM3268]|uniref:Uncharacterized protein n=1 Tax=Campylobacter gracilis RM3268 TaxID=553220 RepID=C8PGA8_9BACT|nr:hypothetical protein CAMGR0001_0901 [Campylobacter gracilis RM3268]
MRANLANLSLNFRACFKFTAKFRIEYGAAVKFRGKNA